MPAVTLNRWHVINVGGERALRDSGAAGDEEEEDEDEEANISGLKQAPSATAHSS